MSCGPDTGNTYRAIESPDVVLDGSTTGSSSVSIALMLAQNCWGESGGEPEVQALLGRRVASMIVPQGCGRGAVNMPLPRHMGEIFAQRSLPNHRGWAHIHGREAVSKTFMAYHSKCDGCESV